MARRTIDPQKMSVAATFYEPVYQRLRPWIGDESAQILAFTSPTNIETRRLLQEAGAVLSKTCKVACFAEVWELHSQPGCDMAPATLAELDRQLAKSTGCHDGRFTAACGTIRWDDCQEPLHQRSHAVSQLLSEARDAEGRGRGR